MKKINVKKQNKISITSANDINVLEIGNSAIEQGFLKLLPSSSLAIVLYLLTHLEEGNYVQTNPVIISNFLAEDTSLETINDKLNYLAQLDLIEISEQRKGDYTYKIYVNLDKLLNNKKSETELASNHFNQVKIREELIAKKSISKKELKTALTTFIPPAHHSLIKDSLNQWLEDFELALIKELIRRVDKWIKKYNNPPEQAFHYLQGIIDDWYQKKIFSYKRLQYFDKLFRETKELAKAYGINWQNLKPVHMETFAQWLTDKQGYALSQAVAKYAIQEAIKRKKDGQPSLKYIEDNFIIPWKKAKVKSIKEAQKLLKKNNNYKPKTKMKKKPKENKDPWENFSWDFDTAPK